MHIKLLFRILRLFGRDEFLILLTDGHRQYQIVDIYPDDRNPFVYIQIEREDKTERG